METFNIICKQNGEVTAYGTWEDTLENNQRIEEWAEYGYEKTSDKYVQGYNGKWYVEGTEPEKPVEELQAEVRTVRNNYLETYVDPKQLVLVWNSLSEEDKKLYTDYRIYLLDYTKNENWYLQNPKTLEEWKNSSKLVEDFEEIVTKSTILE